ncbi:hypothetical protein CY0110_18612 [Crocosphaera chwakensis CCY0110]|uniref:Uncharacterized protein n=1 Tax=Crocosphaera chwakensis CCY0110 TaxID=391612 RepID=A3IJ54_9CHRO|nr:hypothetical protein CY0110_18612 [Crocosphaera chwakensis CCY0110]
MLFFLNQYHQLINDENLDAISF